MPRRDARPSVGVDIAVSGQFGQAEHPRGAESAFATFKHEKIFERGHGLQRSAFRPLERRATAAAHAVASLAAAARDTRHGRPVIFTRAREPSADEVEVDAPVAVGQHEPVVAPVLGVIPVAHAPSLHQRQ